MPKKIILKFAWKTSFNVVIATLVKNTNTYAENIENIRNVNIHSIKSKFYRYLMLYFQLIFIVFPLFFNRFFTAKVPTYKFRHDDLALAKLSFWKMCIRKEFRRKKWSSFGQAIKVRNYYSCYMFSSTILETLTLEF